MPGDEGLEGAGPTGPGPLLFSYTGNFVSGARIDSLNSQNEMGERVLIDTTTIGGPYVYVLFASTDAPGQPYADPNLHFNAKYGASGVLLSSAALSGNRGGGSLVLDAFGDLYVAGKQQDGGSTQAIWISKFDKDLGFQNSVDVPLSDVGNVSRLATDGSFIYAATDGGANNSAKLIKYDLNLIAVATAAYAIGGLHVNSDGISLDGSGNIYVRVSTGGAVGAERHLLKYGPGFNGAAPLADADITALAPLESDVVAVGGSVYTVNPDAAGTQPSASSTPWTSPIPASPRPSPSPATSRPLRQGPAAPYVIAGFPTTAATSC